MTAVAIPAPNTMATVAGTIVDSPPAYAHNRATVMGTSKG